MKYLPFLKLTSRFLLALLLGTLFLGVPLFWLYFCEREADSATLVFVGDSLEKVSLVPLDSKELDAIDLPGASRGRVNVDVDGESVNLPLKAYSCVFQDGRFSPRDWEIRLRSIRPDATVFLREVRAVRCRFFPAIFGESCILQNYDFPEDSIEETPEGLKLHFHDSELCLRPKSRFSTPWKIRFVFKSWTQHMKMALLFILAIVFGLSMLALFHKPVKITRQNVLQMGLVALCAAFFFAIVLPLSSFLANRNAFPFSTGALLPHLLLRFICIWGAMFATFLVSAPVCSFLPMLLVQGFLLYEYLETGILSADFPALTGSTSFFEQMPRQLWDTAVLGLCVGSFLLAGKWIRPYLHWVALGLMVMFGASLLDVHPSRSLEDGLSGDPCIRSANDVIESIRLSPRRNILFFVLDAIDVQEANTVLEENQKWQEILSGFTAYTNNVGMYSHTSYAVPGLLTGRYSPYLQMDSRYGLEAIGTNAFFRPYADAGYPVYTIQSGLAVGWSCNDGAENSPRNDATPREMSPLRVRIAAQMAWTVDEIAMFRALPFLEKSKYLANRTTIWNVGMASRYHNETDLFDRLRQAPIDDQLDCVLQFHHTKGGHVPFIRDRNGMVRKSPDNMDGYFEQSCYAIGEAVRYCEFLKEKGLYDTSLIVLLADHGLTYEHFRNIDRNAHPFLWVKPIGATAPFAFSNAPTSHANIHRMARESLQRNLSAKEITELLSNPGTRIFYTNERRIYYDPHAFDAEGHAVAVP